MKEPRKSNLEFSAFRGDAINKKLWTSLVVLCLATLSAKGQEANNVKPDQPPAPAVTKKVINLWPGTAPGSEHWKQPETSLGSDGMEQVVNVSTPTLTA